MRLHGNASEERVREVLSEFHGKIYQRPPLRSSVKRRLRTRYIYYLDFIEAEDRDILFRVGCESGTYIRKLCFDIGEALGCGAHMQELRRTRAGPFTEEEGLTTLYDVLYYTSRWKETGEDSELREMIHPMEKALELLPKIFIRDSAVAAVCHGASLTAPGVLSLHVGMRKEDDVVIFTRKGEAVAFAKTIASSEQIINMEHGHVARTVKVLMDRDKYPIMWKREGR